VSTKSFLREGFLSEKL